MVWRCFAPAAAARVSSRKNEERMDGEEILRSFLFFGAKLKLRAPGRPTADGDGDLTLESVSQSLDDTNRALCKSTTTARCASLVAVSQSTSKSQNRNLFFKTYRIPHPPSTTTPHTLLGSTTQRRSWSRCWPFCECRRAGSSSPSSPSWSSSPYRRTTRCWTTGPRPSTTAAPS